MGAILIWGGLATAQVPPPPGGPGEIGGWYEQAAKAGDPKIQFLYGVRIEQGVQGAPDMEAALYWYEESAKQGYAPALHRLIALYGGAGTIPANPAKVAQWTGRAAGGGDARSAFNYAVMLETGAGVARDVAAALTWYEAAYDGGIDRAALRLGYLLSQGEAAPEQLVRALMWTDLAGAGVRGYQDLRRSLVERLNSDQQAQAHEMSIHRRALRR
ncbi:Protein of unknown function [Magnetospira sp. QH-2]|nr:Protein of unknown function [Magnetospira sp. QH-2]